MKEAKLHGRESDDEDDLLRHFGIDAIRRLEARVKWLASQKSAAVCDLLSDEYAKRVFERVSGASSLSVEYAMGLADGAASCAREIRGRRSDDMRAFFFGCWDSPGHFIHDEHGRCVRSSELGTCPWKAESIDGKLAPGASSRMLNRVGVREAIQIEGEAVLHLRDDWAALAFWDRSVDTRYGCNGAFLVEGVTTAAEVIAVAVERFPAIVRRLTWWPPRVVDL